MGGKIFQQGANAITTPRMPKRVHDHMRDHVFGILDSLKDTDRIEDRKTAIPAPCKEHFGDIDVLVYKTLGAEDSKDGKPDFRPFLMQLQKAFGAVQKTRTTGDFGASYALPWPVKYEIPRDEINKSFTGFSLAPEHHFVQVDIKVTNSKALFNWQYVVDSHSGPFMFLGPSLDVVCLKGEPKGFFLRVQEMKDAGVKSGSFIHLTSDPEEVCDIVGWDHEKLTNVDGFATNTDLFNFIASSRFFDPKAYRLDKSEETAQCKGSASSAAGSEGSSNSSEGKKEKREPLKTWYQYFVPTSLDDPKYKGTELHAYEIREEMFVRFPHARDAYHVTLNKFLAEQRDAKVRKAIKATFPDQKTAIGQKVGDQHVHWFAVVGLKELLLGDSPARDNLVAKSKATHYPLPDLPNLDPRKADEDCIFTWVEKHWKSVGEWKMRAAPGEKLLEPKTNTTV